MAYIGLRKPFIGKMKEDGTYETPFKMGKAIGIQVTPNYAEGSLNADDIQAEYDKIFNYAEVTLNTSTLPVEAHEKMFGHTKNAESEEIIFNANDENGYVGMAWISVEKVDGTLSYTGNFLCKAKFSEPSEDYATKGDSIEYKTPSITGRASALDSGDWKYVERFTTEKLAEEWINGKFGVTAPAGA